MRISHDLNQRQSQNLRKVSIDNPVLFEIESVVVAATPTILDTGTAEQFVCLLEKGGDPSAYVEYDGNGEAVGYLALVALANSEHMEVRSIAVLPEYQQHGYGKTMMMEAEAIAVEAGRDTMTLVTSPENIRAVRFYQALGYSVINTIENYYGDGASRYVLEKSLNLRSDKDIG